MKQDLGKVTQEEKLLGSVKVGNNITLYRIGNRVEGDFDSKDSLVPGTNVVGTIPQGYRPFKSYYFGVSTGAEYQSRIYINPNGSFTIYNYLSRDSNNSVDSITYTTFDEWVD